MKNKILALAIGCMSLTAKADGVVEPLMGHFVTQGGIQIQVKSGGCTWKKHFEVNREMRDGRIILTFMRKTQDPCRAYIPYGEILTFSFDELDLKTGDVYEMGNGEAPMQVSRH